MGLVDRFFRNYDLIAPPLELFVATKAFPAPVAEQFFLNVAQAAEAFHRRTVGGVDLPAPEHEQRMQQVLTACPNNHRKWLSQKLQFSNEISFRNRIGAIWDALPALTKRLPYDRKRFLQDIVTHRNYLTHYTEALRKQVSKCSDMYYLASDLQVLLEAFILQWLGVPQTVIDAKYAEILERTVRETISLEQD